MGGGAKPGGRRSKTGGEGHQRPARLGVCAGIVTLQCKHPRRDAQRGRVQLAIARSGFLTLEALRTQIENDFVIV
jgi:hypothetical protein